MAPATFRWGILLMGVLLSICKLKGQAVIYSFENENDLSEWIGNDKNRWELTSIGALSGTKSLHHKFDNTQAGTDYLYHAYPFRLNFQDTLVWQFKLKHGYLPSSANRWTFYLATGMPANCTSCNEATLAVGVNMNSSDDALNLYSIDAGGIHRLSQGIFNWEKSVGTGGATVKVMWLANGNYQLWVSNASDDALYLCENIQSNFIPSSCYFGISYTYSSAQDRKLWVDDMLIISKPVMPSKLRVDTFYFLSSHKMLIHFNLPIDPASVNNASIYFYPPLSNISIEPGCQHILIDFPEDSAEGISGQLCLSHLRGRYDSMAFSDTTLNIAYFESQAFDIVFSELMIDPTPSRGLPAFEYIECYNRSKHNLHLSKWIISNGSSQITLPDLHIRSDEYFLLTSRDAKGKFDTIAQTGYCLPSSFLNNDRGTLWLKNEKGEVISYMQYQSKYINDKIKQEGGWSLEIIDPDNPCGGADNWAVSQNLAGGTPGRVNSVTGTNRDDKRPYLCQVALPTDTTCILFFNEPLHPRSLLTQNYTLQPLLHPVQATFFQQDGRAVELTFDDKLQKNVSYRIYLSASIADCSQNPILDTIPEVIVPTLPDTGDVVINEILFETDDSLAEFVELYNTTDKTLDVGELFLTRVDTLTGKIVAYAQPLPKGLLLPPATYLAITNDAEKVVRQFFTPFPGAVFTWKNIFALPDNGAVLSLQRGDGKVIDCATYSPTLHFPLLQRTRGVSLERINPMLSGLLTYNWHSAATSAGYATPGYKNSQAIAGGNKNSNWLLLRSSTFSPNNDGVDDMLVIDIRSPEPAVMITLSLYNAEGRWLRHIVYQQYIGREATFTWDGTVNNRLLSPGIYVIYARLMSSRRIIGETKKACTITY